MDDDTNFGFCRECSQWHPRGVMGSVNTKFYKGDQKMTVRERMCPSCWEAVHAELSESDWGNELRTLGELRETPDAKVVTSYSDDDILPPPSDV